MLKRKMTSLQKVENSSKNDRMSTLYKHFMWSQCHNYMLRTYFPKVHILFSGLETCFGVLYLIPKLDNKIR